MKIKNIILLLLIPIIILLTNFSLLAFSEKYYEEQYIKNNVYEQIQKEELDQATKQLINYLKKGGELQGDYFNEKEKQHLKDVRQIIKYLILTLYFTAALAAIIGTISFRKNKRLFGKALFLGGLLTVALLTIMFFLLSNFESTFLQFHRIAFSNDLWILNPLTDKLIVMFPESFFYETTKIITTRSLITSVFVIIIGLIIWKQKIKQKV